VPARCCATSSSLTRVTCAGVAQGHVSVRRPAGHLSARRACNLHRLLPASHVIAASCGAVWRGQTRGLHMRDSEGSGYALKGGERRGAGAGPLEPLWRWLRGLAIAHLAMAVIFYLLVLGEYAEYAVLRARGPDAPAWPIDVAYWGPYYLGIVDS